MCDRAACTTLSGSAVVSMVMAVGHGSGGRGHGCSDWAVGVGRSLPVAVGPDTGRGDVGGRHALQFDEIARSLIRQLSRADRCASSVQEASSTTVWPRCSACRGAARRSRSV